MTKSVVLPRHHPDRKHYADKYALVVSQIMNRNAYGLYRAVGGFVVGYGSPGLFLDPRQDFGGASSLFSGCTSLSAFCRDVYRESSGEVLPKFCSDRGRAGRTIPNYESGG